MPGIGTGLEAIDVTTLADDLGMLIVLNTC